MVTRIPEKPVRVDGAKGLLGGVAKGEVVTTTGGGVRGARPTTLRRPEGKPHGHLTPAQVSGVRQEFTGIQRSLGEPAFEDSWNAYFGGKVKPGHFDEVAERHPVVASGVLGVKGSVPRG